MAGRILVVFLTIFTVPALVVASVTIEQPNAHQTYVDPWGAGATSGTVIGEPNESDTDWNTYTQVTSDGNRNFSIVWHSEDEWAIPTDSTAVWLNLKIEAPESYVSQGHQSVLLWDRVGDRSLEGSWDSFHVPEIQPLEGMLETSFTVPDLNLYISATGEITTRVQLWQKLDTGSWSRLYETSLTYVPEPATLGLLLIGGLALFRRRLR